MGSYAYDLFCNITSGPLGSYSYAGSTGSKYADPDSPTTVASKTLSYDNNGNLTAIGTSIYSLELSQSPDAIRKRSRDLQLRLR